MFFLENKIYFNIHNKHVYGYYYVYICIGVCIHIYIYTYLYVYSPWPTGLPPLPNHPLLTSSNGGVAGCATIDATLGASIAHRARGVWDQ